MPTEIIVGLFDMDGTLFDYDGQLRKDGLENRRPRKGTGGSNPSQSVRIIFQRIQRI